MVSRPEDDIAVVSSRDDIAGADGEFRQHLGAATGVVGAVGGLGGFLLPALLGILKQTTGSFGPAFAFFGVAAFGAAAWLQWLVSREEGWRQSWRRTLDFAEEA